MARNAASTKAIDKKAKASKENKSSYPTYFQMIKEALLAIHEKGGSSTHAITKYIEEQYKADLPENFRKILSVQLKNSVVKGNLVKVKASYKLSDASKKESSTKIAAEKKVKSTTKVSAVPKEKVVKEAKKNGVKSTPVKAMKTEFKDVNYAFSNSYNIMLNFIQKPANYGFVEVKAACCGLGNLNADVPCIPIS
ncbi:hypothetical protein IFM89_028007 [Coptis chinensis]|uniref:H15 domain-containing protein n=1 Tax=Coptis chinensis TaxID=261450 RepID=A0A835LWX5_9MAGN|nr:hypothetical protein IFM89_028007 [Coptis chinensis]